MDVSVVVPVRNAAEWLPETLASVAGQTLGKDRFELILVDNGSTDGSGDIARRVLECSKLKYRIVNELRGGVATARNRGVDEAQGEWIQFLDADDLLAPNKLDLQMAFARAAAERVGVIYSNWQPLTQGQDGWATDEAVVTPDVGIGYVHRLLSANDFIATGSQLIRRSAFFAVGGFREGIGIIEDVDLALRLAMQGVEFAFCRTDAPLFFYRKHTAGSLSTRDPKVFVDGCVRNAIMTERWARESDRLTDEVRRTLVQSYFQAARFYAECSWPDFLNMHGRIRNLDPMFKPESPRPLRLLAAAIGYPSAERVAVAYRHAKRKLVRSSPH